MSTVLPDTARQLYRAGAARRTPVLDAPVSGSTAAVAQGKLTVLAGGDANAFQAAVPIFRQIAQKWFHLGPSGSVAAMKLVFNTLLGDGMQAIAEAVTLGQKLGLERGPLFDVLEEAPVVAPAHVGKLAQARRRDYQGQFPLRLMRKDFGLILDEAAKQDISTFRQIPSLPDADLWVACGYFDEFDRKSCEHCECATIVRATKTMSDDLKELATQFGGYADGITAFATAQTVGYTLLLAQGDCFALNVFTGIGAAVTVGAIVTVIYAVLVWLCHREADRLHPLHQSIASTVKWVRGVRYFLLFVDIAVTTGLPVLLQYGYLHHQFVVDCLMKS